jgi:hypothetical protein
MKSKRKLNELDVDFIGGQEPLTKEEAEAISKFIKARKRKANKLDNIGIVGTQKKKSLTSQAYHKKKTGEVFRKARAASLTSSRVRVKKAS